MIDFIDRLLNPITMYRLVLYYLITLLAVALVASMVHILPFTATHLLMSTVFLVVVSVVINEMFAKVFKVQTNSESVYISALILALILTPAKTPHDLAFMGWASLWTMASKYIINWQRKHIFNPVAFGVWLAGLSGIGNASWWVGTAILMPVVVIGGLMIARKIRREDMVFTFIVTATIAIVGFTVLNGGNVMLALQKTVFDTAFFFFAFIMLTEPLTTPPRHWLQAIYGGLVGVLFVPQFQLGMWQTTPESALLIGNIFSYLVSPKARLVLHLKQKLTLAQDIVDFWFPKPKNFSFTPGQYMEWTLAHKHTDSRGNRRYFTIASSPTEDNVILGVRFNPNGSSYKQALHELPSNGEIVASQLSGDFVLPTDKTKKLVFIAGGIGITPYRSMIKYLIDMNEKRDIVLLYTNRQPTEFAYKELFDEAVQKLNMKVIYTLTDPAISVAPNQMRLGRISAQMIQEEIPDFKERMFYLSGANVMVKAFEKTLQQMGVAETNIKKDYFPGF